MIEDQIDRAQQRTTLTYRFLPRLSGGIEYNPRADDTSVLTNWVAIREGEKKPALIFGTSSDRIGTPDGQAYYFTFSKDLSTFSKWPISPYLGASYGTWENDLRAIGGVHARPFGAEAPWAVTLIHDGKALHPTVEYSFLGRHTISLLWVDVEEPGIAYSVAF